MQFYFFTSTFCKQNRSFWFWLHKNLLFVLKHFLLFTIWKKKHIQQSTHNFFFFTGAQMKAGFSLDSSFFVPLHKQNKIWLNLDYFCFISRKLNLFDFFPLLSQNKIHEYWATATTMMSKKTKMKIFSEEKEEGIDDDDFFVLNFEHFSRIQM